MADIFTKCIWQPYSGVLSFLFPTGTEHAYTAELHVQVPPLSPLDRISSSAHGVCIS